MALGPTLAHTSDPAVLIPGSPDALRADAGRIDALAQDLTWACSAVGGTDLGCWTGQAQVAYVASQEGLRVRLAVAATSLTAASDALRGHASVLEYAQARAGVLAQRWRASAVCVPATGLTPAPVAEQVRAEVEFDQLRSEVNSAANAAAAVIDAATTDAPIVPTFWNQVGYQWSQFWQGGWESVRDLGIFVWEQNGFRLIWDSEGAIAAKVSLISGLWTSLHDPMQFAKDLVDWDTWHTNPARALGAMTPDAALALITGGTGAAAVRGARASAEVGLRAAAMGALRAGTESFVESVQLSSARRALSSSVSGFWQSRAEVFALAPERGEISFRTLLPDASPRFIKPGYEPGGRWSLPEARSAWFDDLTSGPNVPPADLMTRRSVDSSTGWMDYQRRVAGPEEYHLQGNGQRIWADSVHVDPDGITAVDAKFVNRPGASSIYEGTAPPFLMRDAMGDFDDEIKRYVQVIHDGANPVARLRIITSTDSAGEFLGERAHSLAGPGIDIEVVVQP